MFGSDVHFVDSNGLDAVSYAIKQIEGAASKFKTLFIIIVLRVVAAIVWIVFIELVMLLNEDFIHLDSRDLTLFSQGYEFCVECLHSHLGLFRCINNDFLFGVSCDWDRN